MRRRNNFVSSELRSGVMKFVFILLFAGVVFTSADNDARDFRIVKTAQGPVKGYKSDGIFKFFGIPYATAPTGINRFTAPLPGPVWMHPLEAVNKKVICPQGVFPTINVDLSPYSMQEDCLIANVYTPDTEEKNLPVLVYVHGGGFQVGWGELMTQKSMVKSKKIVAVNFNYRLGAHGFLCLGTKDAPGNAGMKDQVALLRWVQKNIANFGGNPKDVTIVGSSAGSSAVDLLMLSETTKGLYNKAIPESGAGVGVWSVQIDPVQNAKDFAKANNFTNVDDINALEDFYKSTPFEVLVSDTFSETKDSSFVMVPCVERKIKGIEAFLEEAPVSIIKKGKYRKVPILYGFSDLEGFTRLLVFDKWIHEMNEHFSDFLPLDLQFDSEKEKKEVAEKVKNFYFGDKPVGEETVQEYVDYFSDIMFTYPHLRATKLLVEAGSGEIYLYEYTFYSPPPKRDSVPHFADKLKGAPHCAQSAAVHDLEFDLITVDQSEEYLKMENTIREIWLNFVTTGKPVPEGSSLPAWPPAGANRSPYMELGRTVELRGPLLEKRARFWDEIYEKHYRMPVPPPKPRSRDEL